MAGVAVDDLPVYPVLLLAVDDCLNAGADGCGPGSECAASHQGIKVGKQGFGQPYRYLPRLHPKSISQVGFVSRPTPVPEIGRVDFDDLQPQLLRDLGQEFDAGAEPLSRAALILSRGPRGFRVARCVQQIVELPFDFLVRWILNLSRQMGTQETAVLRHSRTSGLLVHVIVPWAILAGLVGAVFELLYRLPRLFRHMEQAGRNVPVVGQFAAIGSMIVAVVLESIWYFVTYLVVPILVVEQTGPISSCKRSFRLFRKTWGKSLIAQVGFELIGILMFQPGLALAALVVLAGLGSTAALIVGIGIGVAWLLVVIVTMSAIVGIFKMALYLYVTTGQEPGDFQGTDLETAFASHGFLKVGRRTRKPRGRTQTPEV